MACEGCNNTEQGNGLDRVFASFWPKGMPYPPMAPYLAAAVSRQQALDWAKAIGAHNDAGVMRGESMAILDLVGKAMMDPDGTYSTQRSERKKKKKDERPDFPDDPADGVPETRPADDDCVTVYCSGCGHSSCCQTWCNGSPVDDCHWCELA